jgi:hypothetical protein
MAEEKETLRRSKQWKDKKLVARRLCLESADLEIVKARHK